MATLILLVLICKGPIPEKIFLHNGQWLPNAQPLTLQQGVLTFERNDITYRLPTQTVDWAKTLRPKPKPKPSPPRPNQIPWEHPMFARKTRTSKPVALSDQGLADFVKHHPYIPNLPEPATEEREVDPTLDAFLQPEMTAKPTAKPAKTKQAKRSKRKKRTDTKDDAPDRTLEDPRSLGGEALDEAAHEDADEALSPEE